MPSGLMSEVHRLGGEGKISRKNQRCQLADGRALSLPSPEVGAGGGSSAGSYNSFIVTGTTATIFLAVAGILTVSGRGGAHAGSAASAASGCSAGERSAGRRRACSSM